MKSLFLFFIFFLFSIYSWSNSKINSSFADFYYNHQISSRHCGRNVSLFIKELGRAGLYSPKMKVLSFSSPNNSWSFGHLVALNSRWGEPKNGSFHQNWTFHVIALLDGKVYDFSFNQTPKILSFDQYLEEMFIPIKPIALYGLDFSVRGQGPYYTDKHARDELEDYQFKILHPDQQGNFTEEQSQLSLYQLKQTLSL